MSDNTPNRTPAAKAPPRKMGAALALEFFSIVVGVLLALALSEWAEDRENRKLADNALVNITNEVVTNQRILQLIHENNVTTIQLIHDNDAQAGGRNIIPGMQLQETAWETLLATGLSAFVDYDELLELSNLYGLQSIYKQTGQQLSQAVMNTTATSVAMGTTIDDTHFQTQFVVYFELLTTIEEQLLKAYAEKAGVTKGAG